MPSTLLLTLMLLAPPIQDQDPSPAPKSERCGLWIFDGDQWDGQLPEPTEACPSWVLNYALPDDPDLDILLEPAGWALTRRSATGPNRLHTVRGSFIDAMVHQAAGLATSPIGPSPGPNSGPRSTHARANSELSD